MLKAWEKDKFGNYVNNDESSINIRENAKANVGMKYLHCKICKKITLHNGKTCCLCCPEVQPKHCLYERNENNEIIGVYCKNHLELIKDFFDFEVTGYFKINNELVTKDINEAIKAKEKGLKVIPVYEKEYNNSNSFCKKDENEVILQPINYIPINIYISQIKKKPVNFVPDGFEIISTGRDQNSIETNSILESKLISLGVTWFVYIKYDENGTPLVVGKSGTKGSIKGDGSIKYSSNDIRFDIKEDDCRAARKYLLDNNLDWNKTQIAYKPCNSEKEALDLEIEIFEKYNLFYS